MAARCGLRVAGTVLFSNMVSAIVLAMLDIVVATAAACNIARIDADSFSTDHLNDPVIITGIVERWPAYHAWATDENATAALAGIRLSAPAAWDYAHDGVSHGESTSSSGRDVAVRSLDNNEVEAVAHLHQLPHLRKVDLSFNHINVLHELHKHMGNVSHLNS